MSLLTNLLIGLTIVYIVGILYVRQSSIELPDWMRITAGVLILIQTKRGIPQVKKISNASTKWNIWGNAGVGFALFVMSGVFIFTLYSAFVLLTTQTEPSISNPKNYLVIPGVNDFIPLTVITEVLIALLLAMVIHELGHAIYCVYEGIGIESTGLVLFGVIPIGAFVEPNEEGQEKASRPSRLRMFSAGVFNNLWTTIITLVLLILVSSTLIAPISGAYIASSETDGLERGDVIQAVNGTPVESNTEFSSTLEQSSGETAQLTLANGEQVSIQKEIFISSVLESSSLESGTTVSQVNGQSVSSISDIKNTIYNSNTNEITVTTADNEEKVYETGATYIVQDSLTVSDTTLSRNSLVRVTSYNDKIIHGSDQIEELSVGDSITFTVNDTTYTETVTDSISSSLISVEGINGLEFKQINASLFNAQLFYNIVSADAIQSVGVIVWFAVLFFAPFGSLIGLNNNYPGFTSDISNFYTVTDPSLSIAEPAIFFGLTVLYWSFWLNCNLFIFNCLPTYALDGGHILRDSFSLGGEKLGIDPDVSNTAISVILLITVIALLLMLGSPIL